MAQLMNHKGADYDELVQDTRGGLGQRKTVVEVPLRPWSAGSFCPSCGRSGRARSPRPPLSPLRPLNPPAPPSEVELG